MLDLFSDTPPWQEPLAPGAVVLRRFARERAPALLQAIADVASQSPFRQMVTPGGYTMSVAMTNCGALGWTTDRQGYLYAPVDPVTDQTWPPMPAVFHELALAAGPPRGGGGGVRPPPGVFSALCGGTQGGWGGVIIE
ncbi:alpha-ketoglutarate-dependent dioxygenase AlkB, partial [Klebsiella pneumoniae]|uniref:alpha-ketoglutarate-dependent dioxygenase AlkB n=1 Tax=Klebsiella pneumoniae TaxID=573 RepID=UPI0030F1B1FE